MQVTSGVATFNLLAQIVLMVALLWASWLAMRHKLRLHCRVMRVIVAAQLLLIGVIMAPQVGRYYSQWTGFSRFTAELVIHHGFAVIALVLAIYINLAFAKVVKKPRHFDWVMRATLLAWTVSLALGIHLFWYIWR